MRAYDYYSRLCRLSRQSGEQLLAVPLHLSRRAVCGVWIYVHQPRAGDTNNSEDIFVRDLLTNTTTRVSVDSAGNQGNGYSFLPSISADRRFVAFSSDSSNIVPGDTNNQTDIFVRTC